MEFINQAKSRFTRNWSMVRQYKAGLLVIWLTMLALSIMDLLSIALVGGVAAILLRPSGEGDNSELFRFFSHYGSNADVLIIYCTMILFLMKSGLSVWMQKRILFFGAEVQAGLTNEVARVLYEAPYSFHLEGNSSGRVKSAIASTSFFVNHSIIPGVRLMVDLITAGAIIVFLTIASPVIALSIFVIITTVVVFYIFLIRKRSEILGEQYLEVWERLIGDIKDVVIGAKELKIYNAWPYFKQRIDHDSHLSSFTLARFQFFQLVPRHLLELVLVIIFLIACLFVLRFDNDRSESFRLLGMFMAGGIRLMPMASSIVSSINSFSLSEGASSDLFATLNAGGNVLDDESAIVEREHKLSSGMVLELKNVCFRYPGKLDWAVDNVSLRIQAGTTVGLFGESGSGKSTLLDVLLGFHRVETGEIRLNGIDVSRAEIQSHVAYVPQVPILLNDSIRRNIAFGTPDGKIDNERVLRALDLAQLSDFVDSLANGLDTIVGENATGVSGGQRQRIALARAVYHDRSILILDEATSAVDMECENDIIQNLKNSPSINALILVGHRPELFSHCDLTYRMHAGKTTVESVATT